MAFMKKEPIMKRLIYCMGISILSLVSCNDAGRKPAVPYPITRYTSDLPRVGKLLKLSDLADNVGIVRGWKRAAAV